MGEKLLEDIEKEKNLKVNNNISKGLNFKVSETVCQHCK